MSTRVGYRLAEDMPPDMPVMIVDTGDRVSVTLNARHDLETLCEGLNVAVDRYLSEGAWVHIPHVVPEGLSDL